jgi:neutral ceramidase
MPSPNALWVSPVPEHQLLAGTYTVDVTPPEGIHAGCWMLHTALAEGAHDPLEVTAIVLRNGETTVALVGIDVCMIDEATAHETRRRVAALTGIAPEAVLINASHNHAGPVRGRGLVETSIEGEALEQWQLALPSRIAGAVYGAARRLRPAAVGFGTGSVPGVGVNRVEREQPVDDSVWVMRIDDSSGRVLAVAVAFACHPVTIGGQTRLWDTDYPGPLRRQLSEELGLSGCLFLQGACGDVAPWDFWFGNPSPKPHSFETRDELAERVAAAAIDVTRAIRTEAAVSLRASTTMLELERRRMAWPAAEVAERASAHVARPDDDYPELWAPDVHTATSAQQFPDYYQKHALSLYRSFDEQRDVPVRAEIQAIAIDGHALIANPFEPFTEIARAIVAGSPFADTRVLGYSNGYSGYLPPPADYAKIDGWSLDQILDQDHARWAYGITTAFVGPEASEQVIEESVRTLERLSEA